MNRNIEYLTKKLFLVEEKNKSHRRSGREQSPLARLRRHVLKGCRLLEVGSCLLPWNTGVLPTADSQ